MWVTSYKKNVRNDNCLTYTDGQVQWNTVVLAPSYGFCLYAGEHQQTLFIREFFLTCHIQGGHRLLGPPEEGKSDSKKGGTRSGASAESMMPAGLQGQNRDQKDKRAIHARLAYLTVLLGFSWGDHRIQIPPIGGGSYTMIMRIGKVYRHPF